MMSDSEIGPWSVHLSCSLACGIGYGNSKGRDEGPLIISYMQVAINFRLV